MHDPMDPVHLQVFIIFKVTFLNSPKDLMQSANVYIEWLYWILGPSTSAWGNLMISLHNFNFVDILNLFYGCFTVSDTTSACWRWLHEHERWYVATSRAAILIVLWWIISYEFVSCSMHYRPLNIKDWNGRIPRYVKCTICTKV